MEIALDAEQAISAVVRSPRKDGCTTGRIRQLDLFTSTDGKSWGEAKISRPLPDSHRPVRLAFERPVTASHLKLVALSEVDLLPPIDTPSR